jgi:hypothetical protein
MLSQESPHLTALKLGSLGWNSRHGLGNRDEKLSIPADQLTHRTAKSGREGPLSRDIPAGQAVGAVTEKTSRWESRSVQELLDR